MAPIPAETAQNAAPLLDDAASVAEIQSQLTARGYYAGPIDGRLDRFTATALSVYQSDAHLAVTGQLDAATQNMLHFGPDVRASIAPIAPPQESARVAPADTPTALPPRPVAPAYAPPPPSQPQPQPPVANAAPPAEVEPPAPEAAPPQRVEQPPPDSDEAPAKVRSRPGAGLST